MCDSGRHATAIRARSFAPEALKLWSTEHGARSREAGKLGSQAKPSQSRSTGRVGRGWPAAATGGCPAGYLRVLLPHPAAGHPWPALDIPLRPRRAPKRRRVSGRDQWRRTRPTCRGLPACRLYRRCRHGAVAGVEAVSRLPTSCRNCRTHDAGMSAGNAGTTAFDVRTGTGECPGPSRASGCAPSLPGAPSLQPGAPNSGSVRGACHPPPPSPRSG